jgi:hypothetical protein
MQVWCGLSADQLDGEVPGLILFPEDVDEHEIARALEIAPEAIVVGAVLEGRRMRGEIWYRSGRRFHYRKVTGDGFTEGGPRPDPMGIYVTDAIAVGLLVCVDVQDSALRRDVVKLLQEAKAPLKVLCVAADTYAGNLFSMEQVTYPNEAGIYVALSNANVHYPDNRLPSFITDSAGFKVIKQSGLGPIRLTLG